MLLVQLIVSSMIFFISILTIYFQIYRQNRKSQENFNLSQVYTPSYLERNPLVCYISLAELEQDRLYIDSFLKLHLNIQVTTDPSRRFNSDIALIPDALVEKQRMKIGEHPYFYISKIFDISFTMIQTDDAINMIKNTTDIAGRRLLLHSNGYVESLWKDIIELYDVSPPPEIVLYDDIEKAENMLINREADAILFLMSHPSLYIKNLSYKTRLRFVPWVEKVQSEEILKFKLKGLFKTSIPLKNYRQSGLSTSIPSFGYGLSLFVKKNLDVKIVETITETVFKINGVVRSTALKGNDRLPFHPGTRFWLEQRGYISVRSHGESLSCKLLVGKSKCQGESEHIAKQMDERNWPFTLGESEQKKDISPLNFIIEARSKIDDPTYGKNFRSTYDLSYRCMDKPLIRTKSECDKNMGLWDAPCLTNKDCPFYKQNTNYPNERGGCIQGTCEMPLNVIKKGFREFESTPICHNCPYHNPTCCRVSSSMSSPDYAFDNDNQDRIANIAELTMRGITA
jgi:hypothetical protein